MSVGWMSVRDRFREILLNSGLLDARQLDSIMEEQRKSGLKLGKFLIHKGILTEKQLVDVVSQQLKLKKFDTDAFPMDKQLSVLVPPNFSRVHNLVPLQRKGNVLTVAMTDPMDINAIDTLETHTNLETDPIVCTDDELCDLMYQMYGISSELDEGLDSKDELRIDADNDDEMPQEMEWSKDVTVFSLKGLAEEAPVIRLVNNILARGAREGASDIHISPEKKYVQMRYRVDGKLRQVPAPPKSYFMPVISRLKILSGLDIAVTRKPQDGRFTFKIDEREIHVRVSTIPTIHGENMVLRLLDLSGRGQTLDELGLSTADKQKVEWAINKPWGMLLSTGPTGSGKSTSLYAMLKEINKPDINIMTLEDPVEYRIEKIRQIQLNRKAGMSFASGLRSILRQDPDVVMVGEIRDAETANIAVQAALTGHRLFSTLHTNDAASAITRLIEMGVEPFLISSTLLVAIAQRLIRKVCPHCREPYTPSRAAKAAMGITNDSEFTFYRGKGCAKCQETGFKGRLGIFEVLVIDEQIQELILNRASAPQITQSAMKRGKLRTLRQDAAGKAAKGITTLEEAAAASLI